MENWDFEQTNMTNINKFLRIIDFKGYKIIIINDQIRRNDDMIKTFNDLKCDISITCKSNKFKNSNLELNISKEKESVIDDIINGK